jgi:hypothetical protein
MKKRITIILIVLLAVAAVRTAIIFYQRRQPAAGDSGQGASSAKLTADDFVVRHKIYAYDLKSAGTELRGKTVWVSAGNQITCYRVTPTGAVDFKHEVGLLAPLERITIEKVILAKTPGGSPERQVMAIIAREHLEGKYAAPIGYESEGNYHFIASDIFFVDDPHEMYQYWPAEVWGAINRHEAKLGMNELQTSFALGTTVVVLSGSGDNVTAEFPNAGKPVRVTFVNNRATQVAPATGSAR